MMNQIGCQGWVLLLFKCNVCYTWIFCTFLCVSDHVTVYERCFLIIKDKTSCITKNTYLLYLNFVCWAWGRWKKMLIPCALLVSIQHNRVTEVTPKLSLLLLVGMLAYVLFPASWLTWRTSRKSMKSMLNVSYVVVVVVTSWKFLPGIFVNGVFWMIIYISIIQCICIYIPGGSRYFGGKDTRIRLIKEENP